MATSQVIFIGGRSGVGKSTVAFALHDLLAEHELQHAVIEGDCLDLAHPTPWKHHLAERNLAAIWANYRDLGYRRLIYTNTVSILEIPALIQAIGDGSEVTAVLLRANESTTATRLRKREQGDSLQRHLHRSSAMAARLDQEAPSSVHRIDTNGQTPLGIAEQILTLSHWAPSFASPEDASDK